jgi:hypothetical protein
MPSLIPLWLTLLLSLSSSGAFASTSYALQANVIPDDRRVQQGSGDAMAVRLIATSIAAAQVNPTMPQPADKVSGDSWMVALTFFLVVVGAGQLIVFTFQLRAFRLQAQRLEQQGMVTEKQVRAYIVVRLAEVVPSRLP